MNNKELSLEFVKEYKKCRESGVPEEIAVLAVLDDLADWKDQHPTKGMWKSVKVIDWLRENIYNRVYECGDRLAFPTADFLNALEKAMEE